MLPLLASQLLFFLTITSLLPSTASADATDWLFPPYIPNNAPVTFESQDTIDASWTSQFVAPELTLFCETNNDRDFSIKFQSAAPVLPNGSYAVPLNTVEDANSDCHLNLNETDGTLTGTANSSNSGNFLVNVQSDRSATTWSASIAAAATSSSISTSATTANSRSKSSSALGTPSAAAATATNNLVSPQTNTGLSSGAKAGIGVGVALGALAFILAGFLLWMRARRKKRQTLPPAPEPPKQEYGAPHASELKGNQTLQELDTGVPQEEKDGFPVARRETMGELEADPAR